MTDKWEIKSTFEHRKIVRHFSKKQAQDIDDLWFDGMWHIETCGQIISDNDFIVVRDKARKIINEKNWGKDCKYGHKNKTGRDG